MRGRVSRALTWLVTLAPMLLGGCVGSAEEKPESALSLASAAASADTAHEGGVIELFSWWARVGESDALGALMREHQKRFPRDNMINASAELSGLARKTLRERLWRGEPPDSFQANIGLDLMQWVLVNGLDARESRLLSLDGELSNVGELRQQLPRALVDLLSYDGRLYGVPTNIHRINSVFYNKRVLRDHGLVEPKTTEDLRILGDRLKQANIPLFALGSREPWTLALFVFECLLISREGGEFYEKFFRGSLRPEDPRMRATLNEALRLLEYANSDHSRLSWLQALDLVVRGQAAMTVMGDWARVSFNAHGMKLGEDYGELPFPGSADTFVFTSDAFSLPRNVKNKAGAKRLLVTMASREGQGAMNLAKGALAARLDVVPSADPVLAEKHRLMTKGPLVLAFSGLVPSRVADDLAQALAEMVAEQDVEPVLLTLRSRYTLLH